jgi:esterase/lipase superfamily enzyme
MADEKHAEWLREGVASWNRRRKKVRFSPDLSDLKFYDFLPPDYRDKPKTSRYFEKINLSDANLENADLSSLNFSKAKFSNSNLKNSNLRMSNFSGADFTDANLTKVDIDQSIFTNSFFDKTILIKISFDEVELDGAVFIANEIDRDQILQIKKQKAKIFNSDADYLSYKAIGVPKTDAVQKKAASLKSDKEISKKNKYDVFFATNRNLILERGEPVDYGDQNVRSLNYGVCEVIVPDGHRMGSLGSPLWKRLKNRQDDRLRLDKIISLSDELFWKLLKDTAGQMEIKEHPTLFIHGFNNTFNDAVKRAAQIGYDLGIGQGIGLFSWASKGRSHKYSADEATVEVSKYLLANFIEDFIQNSPNQKINIIAHSMGCRCLVGALEHLSNGKTSVLKKINQIIMAAADVDAAIMPIQGKAAIVHCNRLTSYASAYDTALKLSSWLHDFPRVGITPPTFVLNGMDTIIVNDEDLGDLSHGYVGTSRTILGDIFALLKHNSDPKDRHAVEAILENEVQFWKIKN